MQHYMLYLQKVRCVGGEEDPEPENIRKYRLSRVIVVESMRQQHVRVLLRPDRWLIDGIC